MKKIVISLVALVSCIYLGAVSPQLENDLKESLFILGKLLEKPNFFDVQKSPRTLSVNSFQQLLLRTNEGISAEDAVDEDDQLTLADSTETLIKCLTDLSLKNSLGKIQTESVQLSDIYEKIAQ